MSPRPNSQLHLPPTEVRHSDESLSPVRRTDTAFFSAIGAGVPVRNSDGGPPGVRMADDGVAPMSAGAMFDAALKMSSLERKWVAAHLGVSVSIVDKWCDGDGERSPSLIQLLQLPPLFHFNFHRLMNRRFGFGRAAAARLMEAIGDLAAVLE